MGTPPLLIWNQAFYAARYTAIFKADFYLLRFEWLLSQLPTPLSYACLL